MKTKANLKNSNSFESHSDMIAPEQQAYPAISANQPAEIQQLLKDSWNMVMPAWPLQNMVAVNPLYGLKHFPFDEALTVGSAYFLNTQMPALLQEVNRQSLKWCQAYFDIGQATFKMPGREKGFYACWKSLAPWDQTLIQTKAQQAWVQALPTCPEKAIELCLEKLGVLPKDQLDVLTLMLTSLPGWASYICQLSSWKSCESADALPVNEAEYTAVRLILMCLVGLPAQDLLDWHRNSVIEKPLSICKSAEQSYQQGLLKAIGKPQPLKASKDIQAQLVFCIDVRSEPIRRAIEAQGSYETFGFAGFFGVPVSIKHQETGHSYASCPVLLKPQHEISLEKPLTEGILESAYQGLRASLKNLYTAIKYAYSTPFLLAEAMGGFSGLTMTLRTWTPQSAGKIYAESKTFLQDPENIHLDMKDMSIEQRYAYGKGALMAMGFTDHFAPLVILCGHGSTTQNNAFATSLDCGACGGQHGGHNARILANILNQPKVRNLLIRDGILIPQTTTFMAGQHNTTTDEISLYDTKSIGHHNEKRLNLLHQHLHNARQVNCTVRLEKLSPTPAKQSLKKAASRSVDWAQTRPEWGLARNASFIVGPRQLTQQVNLDGRSFLHSYDWKKDPDGASLQVILTAPMVVAHWINCQYLFSTLHNAAFGAGSKITKNICGKIGVMQGNSSDIMTGLPLQSLFADDETPYHEPLRLSTVAQAPRAMLDCIIQKEQVLQELFGNGWVHLFCMDPEDQQTYQWEKKNLWKLCN